MEVDGAKADEATTSESTDELVAIVVSADSTTSDSPSEAKDGDVAAEAKKDTEVKKDAVPETEKSTEPNTKEAAKKDTKEVYQQFSIVIYYHRCIFVSL